MRHISAEADRAVLGFLRRQGDLIRQVWTDNRSSDGGIYAETDFRAWYLDWLGDQP